MRDGWRLGTLKDAVRLHYGKALRAADRGVGDVPVVGSSGPFDSHHSGNTRTGGQSIVVGRKGTAGSVAWFDSPVWVTDTAYWAEPIGALSMEFLYLLLQYADLPAVTAQTGVPGLNRDRAYEIPAAIPPSQEQRRIVDLIGALDDTIAAAEGARECARTTARLVRAAAFVEQLSARSVAAGEKFDMLLGRQKSARQSVGDHVIPYLRAANITSEGFRLQDVQMMNFSPQEQEKYCLQPGDVMLVEGGSLGQSSMWSGEIEGPVGFDKHVIRLRAVEGVSIPEYALQWTRWAHESGAFDEQATGVTIRALGFGRASSMPVPDISIEQQERLAVPLAAADRVISAKTSLAGSLRALRSNVLTALLSGEHRIPESYDDLLEAV